MKDIDVLTVTRALIAKSLKATRTRAVTWLLMVLTLTSESVTAGTLSERHAVRGPETKGAQMLREGIPQNSPSLGLPSDLQIPKRCELARAWNDLPKQTNWVLTVHNGVPARVAVLEVGQSTNNTVVVAIHGILSSADIWRYMAGVLSGEYKVWLLDLPGCGLSDCPDPGKLGRSGYSPAAMAERLLQALESCAKEEPEPARLLIAAHSLGGMIALRMFSDKELHNRHAAVLDLVDGFVLFAPADVGLMHPTETWRTVLALNGVKVWLGKATGLMPRAVEKSLNTVFCDPGLASRELAGQSIHILGNSDHRRALQAMLREAIPWREFGRIPDWDTIHVLEASYTNINVPCLIVWGNCDESLLISLGYKMKDEIPDARLVIISETKHSLPLERPELCADLIRQFDYQLLHTSLSRSQTIEKLELAVRTRPLVLAEQSGSVGKRNSTRSAKPL